MTGECWIICIELRGYYILKKHVLKLWVTALMYVLSDLGANLNMSIFSSYYLL